MRAGVEQTIESSDSYNDGQWHHVVAMQGAEGMALYVDGALVGVDPETGTWNYTGYWRIGGDRTWGAGGDEFDGVIDEAAVYVRPLSANEVALHHSLGSTGLLPNISPTAGFAVTTAQLTVSVDGTLSTDEDGTISTYSWDWGDGTPVDSGSEATHTYAEEGNYTVELTVTDDRGASSSSSQVVRVAPNQDPVASFTASAVGLTVEVDASASSDADGAVSSYSWDWGDGSTEDGAATASHTYDEEGTYTVTLTVTDDSEGAATFSAPVTVSVPTGAGTYARDDFNRVLATGLGSADAGGSWSLSNSPSNYLVDGDSAVLLQPAGGSLRNAYLSSVDSTDTAVQVDITLPELPEGGSEYVTITTRDVGGQQYRARVIVAPSGGLTLQLQVGSTVVQHVPIATQLVAAEPLRVRAEATGTSPTQLRVKVWKAGAEEPDTWMATATDSTPTLQASGSVGLGVYLSGGATNVPFRTQFDNFWAGSTDGDQVFPGNELPEAVFSVESSGLVAVMDASGSSDPDGSVESYVWDFGDGASGSGSSVTHEFAAAGTYEVTLTVTDDDGAEASSTQSVEVIEEAEPDLDDLVRDGFDRPDGQLGTAPLGGAWTQTSGASNVGIEDGRARFTASNASQIRSAALTEVTTDNADLTFAFSVSDEIVSGNLYVSAIGRSMSGSDYRARWIIQPGGKVQAQLTRGSSVMAWQNLSGMTLDAGTNYLIRVQVFGIGETTIRSKIWVDGAVEPAEWQMSTTDTTPGLQGAGHMGIETYVGGGFDPLPISVYIDDFVATEVNP